MCRYVFVFLVSFLAGCTQLNLDYVTPKLSVTGIDVKREGLTPKLYVYSTINNPNPFSIDLDNIRYSLKLEKLDVVSGSSTEKWSLAANDSVNIPFVFNIDLENFLYLVAEYVNNPQNQLQYSLDVTLDPTGILPDFTIVRDGSIGL